MKDEIKVLPEKYYKQVYGDDYDPKSWKLRFSGLSESEKRAILPVLESLKFDKVYWIPEVDFPQGIHTPDLFNGNSRIEIKTITTKNSIQSQIKKASLQISESDTLILDSSESKLKQTEIKKEVSQKVARYSSSETFIVKGEKIIKKIKSSAHASQITDSNRGANEAKLFNNSILPQNPEKIKGIFERRAKTPQTAPDYWAKRAETRFETSEKLANPYIRKINEIYEEGARRTIAEIKKLYANYYKKDQTFDKVALNAIEPRGNVQRFKEEMEELGLNQYLPDNYAFRMSRLEMLNNQIWAELKQTGQAQADATTSATTEAINNSYHRAIFDISQQAGAFNAFSKLDTRTLDEILSHKIEGKHFSQRIWNNTELLTEQIQGEIATAVSIGESYEKTIRRIRDRFEVGKFYAERLVRTETAFFHGLANLRVYEEAGIEEYQIVAMLDRRTSKICQHQDHKTYKVEDAKQGVNYPPFHPLCRTTTVAYFGEKFKSKTRSAQDPTTGKNYITENVDYETWA